MVSYDRDIATQEADQERKTMSKEQSNQPAAFPYVTQLNILFPQLEKFDVPMLGRAVSMRR
jgi:hypothetical protein